MKKVVGLTIAILLVTAMVLSACAAPAPTVKGEYRWSYAFLAHPEHAAALTDQWFFDELKTQATELGYSIEILEFYNASLLPASDMLKGVADGRADFGLIFPAYALDEMPLTSIVERPGLAKKGSSLAAAMRDLQKTYEPLRQEWEEKNNVKYIANYRSYWGFMGVKDVLVKVPADLKGLKIRVYGRAWDFIERVGGTPIAMPWTELYTALETGLVDGEFPTGINAYAEGLLGPVEKYGIHVGIGPVGAMEYLGMNFDVWNGLPDDLKNLIDEIREGMLAKNVEFCNKETLESADLIKAEGIFTWYFPTEAELQLWSDAYNGDEYWAGAIAEVEAKGLPASELAALAAELTLKYDDLDKFGEILPTDLF